MVRCKGYKVNFFDSETRELYWVANPSKLGDDSLFSTVVEIDKEARVKYWSEVRMKPHNNHITSYRSPGKSKKKREAVEKAARRFRMDRGFSFQAYPE